MVTVDLAPGNHTIKMDLNGYDSFEGVINVSETGRVTCISVVNGACHRVLAPGMMVNGNVVTGYLKVSSMDSCAWITGKGGWDKIVSFDIIKLVRAYTKEENLGFDVKAADIMGAVAYYSKNKDSGNALTGCNF